MTEDIAPRPPLGPIRRIVRRMAGGNLAAHLMLSIMVVLTVLILTTPTRTIQLQARTLSAQVQVMSEPLEWNLDGAVVCEPSLDRNAKDGNCGEMAVEHDPGRSDYEWLRGQQLLIDWSPDALRITALTEGKGFPADTYFLLSHEDARRNGALAFVGHMTLGQEIGAGATGYVLEGTYAIYEKGLLARLVPPWSPDITREGKIRRGDQIRILCQPDWFSDCGGVEIANQPGPHPNQVFGSITMDDDDEIGMNVVVLGVDADSFLEIAYLGRSEPLLVRSSWFQRAAASSGLIALSLLFSLIAPLLLPYFEKRKS